MQSAELIPHLFRTEYRKIVAVLCKLFGIAHIEIAEDIVSETFLLASELWSVKGLPENPTAWIYTVAKNKTKDYLKRDAFFAQSISKEVKVKLTTWEEIEVDLSIKNIDDSQLAMIFVVCHPYNPVEAQIALSLNLLCGFSADEIANALLTSKAAIYKSLQRSKEKLRKEKITISQPNSREITKRLPAVLTTIYLLFNEGYYSSNEDITLRKNLCLEAMRLTLLLIGNEQTNHPFANALLALMCFHSSRFDARLGENGEIVLYQDQDTSLWNQELISKGEYFLQQAKRGDTVSKYHLEAGIAYWHSLESDYALAKVEGKKAAIIEAEKINLEDNYLYHSLLGELHIDVNNDLAIVHFRNAVAQAKSTMAKMFIEKKIAACKPKQR